MILTQLISSDNVVLESTINIICIKRITIVVISLYMNPLANNQMKLE